MPRARTTGQRAGLTPDQVTAAARELLGEGGLEAVTMRGVAERLGVRPNALYSHVASKAELVEILVDDVLAAVQPPEAPTDDWRGELRGVMVATHRALLGHPELVPLLLGRGSRGPHAQRLGAAMLEQLGRGGITGAAADEGLRVLVVFTIGFAAFSAGPGFDDAPATRADDLSASFDHGLDWLLAGIAGAA